VTPTIHVDDERWTRSGPVSVRGRAFRDDELLAGDALCAHFEPVGSLEAFAAALDGLNGFFAVAVDLADALLVGVDHVRSIPLLYAPAAGIASDDAAALVDRLGAEPDDPLAESELLVSGSVLDNRTLVSGLLTVRPGEAVRLDDGGATTRRYADYRPRPADGAAGDAGVCLAEAVDAAFDRFARVIGDRQVAVALSGGYDSRLVVTELAARDLDVLAYSFGRPDVEEARIARDVATALDVPWAFAEYSTERWGQWYRSAEREAYVEGAFTYDSIPNYGALPALSELRGRGVIDADAVCTSGQTVAGMSEDPPRELETGTPTQTDLIDALVRYWSRWEWENPAFEAAVRTRITGMLSGEAITSAADAFARFERWKWADRHVKYFLAEVREYDFHDLAWWLPLWDREVVAAWAAVPSAKRREKQLFRALVDRRFAAVAGLDRATATAMTTETNLPTFAGRVVDRAAERIVDSPIAPLLRGLYWRLQRRRSAYGDHPLGWYGIVPPDLFVQLYSGREDIHAFQTLATVGRASFVDGTVTDPPRDGVLSVPYTGAARGRQ